MDLSENKIVQFQKKILTWYAKNRRDLPWRKTRDPYHIFVSEVMLQQTQVGRVIPKFEQWLRIFPTIDHLAHASTADVLGAWSGLGYNRRALYLRKGADSIVREYKGQFPRSLEQLKKIPGIGEYTARALLCFAFNEQVAVVDTNVRKVIAHTFFKGDVSSDKVLQRIAEEILPRGKAYEWNQALMDYANLEMADAKIAIAKQSSFIGSNRYYRGQTIKYLLRHKSLSSEKLRQLLNLEREKFMLIMQGLCKDGLITQHEEVFTLT